MAGRIVKTLKVFNSAIGSNARSNLKLSNSTKITQQKIMTRQTANKNLQTQQIQQQQHLTQTRWFTPTFLHISTNQIHSKWNEFGQPTNKTHPHLVDENELTPQTTKQEYQDRRNRLMDQMPLNSILILSTNPELYKTEDIPHDHRPNSHFYYLTGYMEPTAVLVFYKPENEQEDTKFWLFVRAKDPQRAIWDGPRSGLDGAKSYFGADESYSFDSLVSVITPLIGNETHLFISATDGQVRNSLVEIINSRIKNENDVNIQSRLMDPSSLIDRMRVHKSDSEIHLMVSAGLISSQAMVEVMRRTRPGLSEGYLAALFEFECKVRGAQRIAYPCVVASGINNNILHYVINDQIIRENELVLMDAGGEYHCYAADITRTFPASGKFTIPQLEIYNAVLRANEACIEKCRPGVSLIDLHKLAESLLFADLQRLNIPVTSGGLKRFFPHSIGHFLGSDVHDTRTIPNTFPLQSRCVITIEPGLYIPNDPDIPEQYRGIGIRIEDNVLITDDIPDVLTAGVPKDPSHIEQLMHTATLY